ncbi:battenin isoform X2 [Mobula hypostoma]|uniref:battenin isoform X2 n=1 Tax=Mobula hypostoma TaxID=723540 RepID=UPI002FC2BF7B
METPGGGDASTEDRRTYWRNIIGFWILGLCNNFSYVIMLSAAHDILSTQEGANTTRPTPPPNSTQMPSASVPGGGTNRGGRFDCNSISTAAILLADILPTLIIKLVSPFLIHLLPYGYRVLFCCFSALTSFIVVSFSVVTWISILGVVFASVSSGLGEYTFLSLTAHFQTEVVWGWASGTGAAGLFGALSYSGLTQGALTPRHTLQLMVLVPVIQWASYFCLLVLPPTFSNWGLENVDGSAARRDRDEGLEEQPLIPSGGSGSMESHLNFSNKMQIIQRFLKYTVPLSLIYFAEYFINQGLFELLYFPTCFLGHSAQYRWYQTIYQAGVFASRSSAKCFRIHRIWIPAVLQFVNLFFLLSVVWFSYLPTIWIVFAIILYEGLLGGAGYVNTFNNISEETSDREREFAMGAASIADTMGIAISGAVALPFHNWLCQLG